MDLAMSAAAMCIILLITAKVDCRKKTAMPSIHSSRVVSTAEEGRTSSCAVVEEGVPMCQDPDDDIAHEMLSAMRTPYPDNGFYGARDDRKTTTSRPLGWWWRFIDNLKRNLGKKHPVSSTTTVVRKNLSPPPETIVTYSIKGCSPTKMLFDLSPCGDLSRTPLYRVSTTRVVYYVPPTSQIGISEFPFDFDL